MTAKTLGQVLYDADHDPSIYLPYGELHADRREFYERIAQAVAAVERERCAQAAWRHYMDMCKKRGVSPASFERWSACGAIRSMK